MDENVYLTQLKQHAQSIEIALMSTQAEIDHYEKMLFYAKEQKKNFTEALVNAHKQIVTEEENQKSN